MEWCKDSSGFVSGDLGGFFEENRLHATLTFLTQHLLARSRDDQTLTIIGFAVGMLVGELALIGATFVRDSNILI